jgi:hypothetical protein
MKRNVAIENTLAPMKSFLSEKGYNVESVDFSKEYTREMDKYDAVVVTGMNKNFMGVEDTTTRAVIIEAKGLTAEQVYNEIESRLH